jgi:hypothetical protein
MFNLKVVQFFFIYFRNLSIPRKLLELPCIEFEERVGGGGDLCHCIFYNLLSGEYTIWNYRNKIRVLYWTNLYKEVWG